MNSHAMRLGMQVGIGKVDDRMAEVVSPQKSVDPRAQPLRLSLKTERAQYCKPRGLQQKARTQRPRFGKALENGDAVPGVGKERRRSLPRHATANDSDFQSRDRHVPSHSPTEPRPKKRRPFGRPSVSSGSGTTGRRSPPGTVH